MRSDEDDRFRFRAKAMLDLARPWVEQAAREIMLEDALPGEAPRPFALRVAEDRKRSAAAPAGGPIADYFFRYRDVARSSLYGREVRHFSFWKSGDPGEREYDLIRKGFGEFYVHAWFRMTDPPRPEAVAILDLSRLRALPVSSLVRMEESGPPSPIPFVGLDVAALINHGCVRRYTPGPEYFARYALSPRKQIPGQETML